LTEVKEKKVKNEYQKSIEDYTLAIKAYRKGDFVKAIELFKTFLDKHQDETELLDRAKIYLSISETRSKKTSLSLKTFEDYYQYSVYQINRGDFTEAFKLLEKARGMKPKEGKVPYLMAVAAVLNGDEEGCLEYLKQAVKLDGFFGILAQNEKDFESIREDKKFKLITSKA
jgi:tetratricopeptide (TPR) repeat protein